MFLHLSNTIRVLYLSNDFQPTYIGIFIYFNLIYQKEGKSLLLSPPYSLEEFRKGKYEPKSLLARVHGYQAERVGSFPGKWSCLKCQMSARRISEAFCPPLPSQTQNGWPLAVSFSTDYTLGF